MSLANLSPAFDLFQWMDPSGAGQVNSAVNSGVNSVSNMASPGGKKGAPAPPDYTGAAQQQGASSAANVGAQTAANRPNQSTTFANSNWVLGPNGQWTQQTGLAGPLGGAANSLMGQAASNFGSPLDNGTATRDKVTSQLYDAATSRLDPQFRLQDEQVQANLANQGLDPTSAAARAANNQEDFARNDAYTQAMKSAQEQGTAAGQAAFEQNLAARNAPLQEMGALQGLEQMPSFMGAGMADPTQYLAAAMAQGNYGMQGAQMRNSVWADILGGLGGAASKIPFAFAGG
jgi:hypothetical protein